MIHIKVTITMLLYIYLINAMAKEFFMILMYKTYIHCN